MFLCLSVCIIIIAIVCVSGFAVKNAFDMMWVLFWYQAEGVVGDNNGIPYRVPVSARHQSCESTGEKKDGGIFALASSTATSQVFPKGNTRRIQVSTASIHARCNFNGDLYFY